MEITFKNHPLSRTIGIITNYHHLSLIKIKKLTIKQIITLKNPMILRTNN